MGAALVTDTERNMSDSSEGFCADPWSGHMEEGSTQEHKSAAVVTKSKSRIKRYAILPYAYGNKNQAKANFRALTCACVYYACMCNRWKDAIQQRPVMCNNSGSGWPQSTTFLKALETKRQPERRLVHCFTSLIRSWGNNKAVLQRRLAVTRSNVLAECQVQHKRLACYLRKY